MSLDTMGLVRPGSLRKLTTIVLGLGLALMGCTDPNSFAPTCPVSAIVPDTGDVTHWRSGPPGSNHDVTDLVLSGRITGVVANCFAGAKPGSIRAKVKVELTLNRGPAATGRAADVAYFVAVTRGDTILDKAVYPIHTTFPPNIDQLKLVGDEVDLVLPTPKGVSGPDYTVETGFQLSPEELADNRARAK
jgi:hypothetical protein